MLISVMVICMSKKFCVAGISYLFLSLVGFTYLGSVLVASPENSW